MILTDLRIMTMDKPGTIERGFIRFDHGRITEISSGDPPDDDENVNCGGLTLMPGFIDAHTHIGIAEDSIDFEGDDTNEDSDPVTPQMRALDGINPFDRCFSEARAAGITTAAVAPGSANPIGGQICVLKTAGKRVDSMLVKAPAAIKFALGENPKSTYHAKNLAPVTRMATAALIRETLYKAKRYADDMNAAEADDELDPPEYDLKSESLLPLLRGEIPAHFHAHRADDIFTAVRIAQEFSLKFVIIHCTDGHLIADELSEIGVPAVVGPSLTDRCKPELRGQSIENPAILAAAGVKIALTTDHPVTPLQYLPLCAEVATRNGLDREAALRAMTVNPAEILGISDRVGSLAVGKDADFVLVEGDPLSGKVKAVFIDGKLVSGKLPKDE